ncbi:Phenylacetate-CoA oxygenase/reductase, PaaK subunit [Caballeronia sordidicola]|uniref:Phenylacetate-CoA oxygenase/reductase, PaaK subunit n=1 Tax=Caballeronia sordidicola TaxID=196367 RepID=A0A242MD81_CABSO|nr:Phenylacetate-CoA oxygenase/reductase, PaaK subunit [Caballeronia sordidicola]
MDHRLDDRRCPRKAQAIRHRPAHGQLRLERTCAARTASAFRAAHRR